MKTRTATLTFALTAALGTAGVAYAANGNPFALNDLSQGYQIAQAEKAKDGKCGEGKCGATKTSKATDAKAKDGKCGEGKCGGTKNAQAADPKQKKENAVKASAAPPKRNK
ncbi:MAG: hypothetical protein Q8K52_01320 [Thiobacillus sp.]|nr:hypothetical protein [Thiobacillus sp.]